MQPAQIAEVGRKIAGRKKQLTAAIKRIVSLVCDTSSLSDNEQQPDIKSQGQMTRRSYRPQPVRKKIPMDWWLKTDSLKMLLGDLPFSPDRYLLSFNKQTVGQAGKMKGALGKKARMVTWALPPLIMENDLARVHKQIQLLLRTGFRSFQLGHLSQRLFFKGEKVHLFADYTANLYNSQAVAMVGEIGIGAAQAGIEMDRRSLQELLCGCRSGGDVRGMKEEEKYSCWSYGLWGSGPVYFPACLGSFAIREANSQPQR